MKHLPCCLLLLASSQPALAQTTDVGQEQPEANDESRGPSVQVERDVAAHNYLVTRLQLLQRGAAIGGIRAELTSELDLAGLSADSLELLRKTLELCNRAAVRDADASSRIADLEEKERGQDEGALGRLLLRAVISGGTDITAAFDAIELLDDSSASSTKKLRTMVTEATAAEIANLTFDLALLRSRLQSEESVRGEEFLRAADYEGYSGAFSVSDYKERLAVIAASYARSPKLQPAALYLASHQLRSSNLEEAERLAQASLAASPIILLRDPLRTQAYQILASVERQREGHAEALAWIALGLAEDPASTPLLREQVRAYFSLGDYPSSYATLENLDLLVPEDSWVLYNLACCHAVVDKDASKALATLARAFGYGWDDVSHTRQDPDLELMRNELPDQFEVLVTPKLSLKIRLHSFGADDLVLVNRSPFPLQGLDLKVYIHVQKRGGEKGARSRGVPKRLAIPAIGRGDQHVAQGLVKATRRTVLAVEIRGTCKQGKIEFTVEAEDLYRRR